MVISRQAADELADIIVGIGKSMPDTSLNRMQKIALRSSRSGLATGIFEAKSEVTEGLSRLHLWMHVHDIPVAEMPKENSAFSERFEVEHGDY